MRSRNVKKSLGLSTTLHFEHMSNQGHLHMLNQSDETQSYTNQCPPSHTHKNCFIPDNDAGLLLVEDQLPVKVHHCPTVMFFLPRTNTTNSFCLDTDNVQIESPRFNLSADNATTQKQHKRAGNQRCFTQSHRGSHVGHNMLRVLSLGLCLLGYMKQFLVDEQQLQTCVIFCAITCNRYFMAYCISMP